jgi:hypothetical protein
VEAVEGESSASAVKSGGVVIRQCDGWSTRTLFLYRALEPTR